MTGFQFKIWDVIVSGTFVPIVKWNKEAWGWNIRQLSMLTARSQQGVNPAIPPPPPTAVLQWATKATKNTPNNRRSGAAPVGQQCIWSSSICERRQSSLGLTFVVNTWWDAAATNLKPQDPIQLYPPSALDSPQCKWQPPRHSWTITYCSWNSLVTFCDPLSERSSLVHWVIAEPVLCSTLTLQWCSCTCVTAGELVVFFS